MFAGFAYSSIATVGTKNLRSTREETGSALGGRGFEVTNSGINFENGYWLSSYLGSIGGSNN